MNRFGSGFFFDLVRDFAVFPNNFRTGGDLKFSACQSQKTFSGFAPPEHP
jgi:hypothetical protein